jgi:hypothetical protein
MTFYQRAIGAAKLSVPIFEEIEADRTATTQALVIVVLSNFAAGIGLRAGIYTAPVLHRVMLALLLWLFWAIATYIVGVYLMPEPQTQTNVGELLRTIGFAAAPGILRIFGVVPIVGGTIYVVSTLWMVIAIRQALDYTSTGRAVIVCIITGLIGVVMAALFGALLFVLAEEVVF